MRAVRVAIIGAGGRGRSLSNLIASRTRWARIVAVAEPREDYREDFAHTHHIEERHCFRDWRDLFAASLPLDAVVVATMDRDHTEPSLAALAAGHHLLMEKPMAPSLEECERIAYAFPVDGNSVSRSTLHDHRIADCEFVTTVRDFAGALVQAAAVAGVEESVRSVADWERGAPINTDMSTVLNNLTLDAPVSLGAGIRLTPLTLTTSRLLVCRSAGTPPRRNTRANTVDSPAPCLAGLLPSRGGTSYADRPGASRRRC